MLVCNIALQVAFSLVCVVLLWVYMQGHLRYTWLVLACCVVPFIAYSGGLASFNASCKSSLEELKSLLHVTEVT